MMHVRTLGYQYAFLNSVRSLKKPKHILEIPGIDIIWTKFKGIKLTENKIKKNLLDELIDECKVNKPNLPLHFFEKIIIVQSSTHSLMKRKLISSVHSLVDDLLSQLEPFPFDNTFIVNNESNLSIQQIRNEIEKQYLAWKYKMNLEDMKDILNRYKLCLYEFRSLGSLKRNVDQLENLPKSAKICVPEKIYHINQKPFHVNTVGNFQEIVAGLNWQLFPHYCPKILRHSHQYLLFVISTLRDLYFTEKQIHEGLPFLYLTFEHFIRRLNHMLTHAEISKRREEEKFLYLLSYPSHVLRDLVDLRRATFTELIELISISSKTLTPRLKLLTVKSILYHVNQFFPGLSNYGKLLKKHAKYKLASEKEIQDTLVFLKSQNFRRDELAESLTIVLYPRKLIEGALAKVEAEADTLKKYGFTTGSVNKETNNFESGTREKRKILQLCLYYLEKPYHFSGDGIWGHEINSDEHDYSETIDGVCS